MGNSIKVGDSFTGAAISDDIPQQEAQVPETTKPAFTQMVTGYPEKPETLGPIGRGKRVFIADDDAPDPNGQMS